MKLVLKDKYALIVMLAQLVQSLSSTTASSMSMYYFTYVYGDVSKAAIPGFVSAIVLLGVAAMPVLVAKWGKSKTIIYTFAVGVVASLLRYFMPTNLVWYTGVTAIYGFAAIAWMIAIVALVFYDLDKKMPQIHKETSK